MDDFAGARGTARGIFFEATENEVVERARQAGLERAGRRGSADGDVVHDRERAGAGEGRLAGDGFVEDGAEGEDVGAAIEIVAASLFGRHVGDGADDDAGVGDLGFGDVAKVSGVGRGAGASCAAVAGAVGANCCACDGRLVVVELGEAEVENFGVAALGDENIGGLDVAMNDVFLMGGVERVGDFDAERDEHFEGERALGDVLFSVAPWRNSIAMKAWPFSSPTSWIVQMFG